MRTALSARGDLTTHGTRLASAVVLSLLGTSAVGCGPGSGAPAPNADPDGLVSFTNCDQYSAAMREQLLAQLDQRGYAGSGAPQGARTSDVRTRVAGAAPADPSPTGSTGFATPAPMVTDGHLVLVKSDQKLLVADFDGAKPVQRGTLTGPALRGGGQLLLAGDRVLIVIPGWTSPARTRLTLVSLRDPAHPSLVGSELVAGYLLAATAHNAVIRIVQSADPEVPVDQYAKPGHEKEQRAKVRAGIESADAATWLPKRQITDGPGATSGEEPLLDCTSMYHPAEAAGTAVVSVLTIDPTRDDALAAAESFGVLADGRQVNASPDRIYLASTRGWGSPQEEGSGREPTPLPLPENPRTQIHVFDAAGRGTDYLGSGSVPNYVDGAGAMSGREGTLRVVTTSLPPWCTNAAANRRVGTGSPSSPNARAVSTGTPSPPSRRRSADSESSAGSTTCSRSRHVRSARKTPPRPRGSTPTRARGRSG